MNSRTGKPHVVTNVHDHGDVWTLYGLIEGRETIYRYERTDGGPKDSGPANERLNAEVAKALHDDGIRTKIGALGGEVEIMSVARFNAFIAKECVLNAEIVKLIGYPPQ